MKDLTSKQRAYLRSMANTMPAIFQVGKGGITEALARQVCDALEARELVKITVLESAFMSAREACDLMAEATDAFGVQVIGNKFVLYKESRENKKIELK